MRTRGAERSNEQLPNSETAASSMSLSAQHQSNDDDINSNSNNRAAAYSNDGDSANRLLNRSSIDADQKTEKSIPTELTTRNSVQNEKKAEILHGDDAAAAAPVSAVASLPKKISPTNKPPTLVETREKRQEKIGKKDESSASPPVKVIHTTTTNNNSSVAATLPNEVSSSPSKNRPHHKGPKYLDENTISLFKNYLKDHIIDTLDEDDVLTFALRMHRIADQQATYQRTLDVAASQRKRQDSGDDSDDDDDRSVNSGDTSIFEECLEEEETHSVAHDFFKKIVAGVQDEHIKSSKGTKPPSRKAAAGGAGAIDNTDESKSSSINKLLDKKTLLWIKRAAGMHRSDQGVMLKNGRISTRRYTRKQARDKSCQKKSERGLDILDVALAELEPEHGPFPKKQVVRKTKRAKKKSRKAQEAILMEERRLDKKLKRRKKDRDEEGPRRKKKKTDENEDPKKETKRGEKDKKRRSAKEKAVALKKRKVGRPKKEPPRKRICTSLRMLDWLWRDQTMQFAICPKQETELEFYDRSKIPLHPKLEEEGIVHRLPRFQYLAREHEYPKAIPARVFDPPRRRHSNEQYAVLCFRLIHALQGQARLFATCEFFYSDLDREWYNDNGVAEKLGIPRDTRLTQSEWKATRSRLTKPRRFSRSFIKSQLNERNEYRCKVRMLQNNPHLSASTDFPYNVYAPIRVGTTVSAYSKRFRIIQRGRVLSYDRKQALYLVEFENKQFGFELCPDSDVATAGRPKILIPASKASSSVRSQGLGCLATGSRTGPALLGNGMILRGTSSGINVDEMLVFEAYQKMPDTVELPKTSQTRSKTGSLNQSTTVSNKTAVNPCRTLVEDVANNDAFLTLLEVIDNARIRKRELLTLIDDANALMVQDLPFGNIDRDSSTNGLAQKTNVHLKWLLKNLAETNRVLRISLVYLQSLYGPSYDPSRAIIEKDGEKNRVLKKLVSDSLQNHEKKRSTVSDVFVANLVANTDEISTTLSSKNAKALLRNAVTTGEKSEWLVSRLKSAIQLVSTASFVQQTSDANVGREGYAAMSVAEDNLAVPRFQVGISDVYNSILLARDQATRELKEALDLFKTELELTCLKQSAVQT